MSSSPCQSFLTHFSVLYFHLPKIESYSRTWQLQGLDSPVVVDDIAVAAAGDGRMIPSQHEVVS